MRDSPTGLLVDRVYSVTLNDFASVPLRGSSILFLIAGQTIQIREERRAIAQERYHVQLISYTYGFALKTDRGEQELLTFHWASDPHSPGDVSSAHVHIGSVLLAQPTPIRPGDFQNAHVPTGRLSLAAVIRFAIAELEVTPLVSDWASILQQYE